MNSSGEVLTNIKLKMEEFIMPAANAQIQFKAGLYANYKAITAKDVNTVYFCTDTAQLFVGEAEYSRNLQSGTTTTGVTAAPGSLFYNTTAKALYYTADGTTWVACANFYTHPTFTAKVVGANTAGAVAFGGSVKIPKVTTDANGHVSAAEDITITLPSETKNTVEVAGSGNAVTAAAFDAAGHKITLTKGETFATKKELTDAVNGITDFDVDSNGGEGYASLDALKTAHATGAKGVFYLVKNPNSQSGNAFVEYFWTGTAYEKAGDFGGVDLSSYATKKELTDGLGAKVDKTTTVNGHALSGNVSVTKADVGLGNVDNTADASKSVASAAKLTTARKIALTGGATGEATFDGAANASIAVTVNQAAAATKATQDGSGNVITTTYATKTEVANSTPKWGTF